MRINQRVLYGAKSGKEIARIQSEAQDEFLPVRVGNREVGALSTQKPTKDDALSQRAFGVIPENLSEQEEQLFIALVTRELGKQSIPA